MTDQQQTAPTGQNQQEPANQQQQMQLVMHAIEQLNNQMNQLATNQQLTAAAVEAAATTTATTSSTVEMDRPPTNTTKATELSEVERRTLQTLYGFVVEQAEARNPNYTARDLREIAFLKLVSSEWQGSWVFESLEAGRAIERQWFLYHLVARKGWQQATHYMTNEYDAVAKELPTLNEAAFLVLPQPRTWTKPDQSKASKPRKPNADTSSKRRGPAANKPSQSSSSKQ